MLKDSEIITTQGPRCKILSGILSDFWSGHLIFVKLFFVLTSARSLQQQCPNRCSYSCAFGNSFRA